MKKIPFIGALILPVMLVLAISSCQKDVKPGKETAVTEPLSEASIVTANKMSNAGMSDLLKSVRSATSRFNSTTQAIRAGYQPDDHCVSVPGLGGMGYHWVNPNLVDTEFDTMKPEVILYAQGPGGNLRMVAIEYIVIKSNLPRPMFGNQVFDDGGTPIQAPHWSLHVWLYEENPNGMFTPFNPNISCQ